MKSILFILPIFYCLSSLSHANEIQVRDGNQLLSECQSVIDTNEKGKNIHDAFGEGYCLGLLQGFSEMNSFYKIMKGNSFFCIPKEVTLLQKTKVVIKYLNENPNKLHKNESFLVHFAFSEAFPCAQ